MSRIKKIFTILTVLWMAVIFAYSAQPGDESGETSIWAGMMFGKIFVPNFEDWSEEKQVEFAEKIDHPVRKAAHFTEYTILGFLIAVAYVDNDKKRYKKFLVPWLFGSVYAATDEFHQRFVPGRNGNIFDVMLDSSGVAFGVCLVLLMVGIGLRCKAKSGEADSIDRKST